MIEAEPVIRTRRTFRKFTYKAVDFKQLHKKKLGMIWLRFTALANADHSPVQPRRSTKIFSISSAMPRWTASPWRNRNTSRSTEGHDHRTRVDRISGWSLQQQDFQNFSCWNKAGDDRTLLVRVRDDLQARQTR